MTKIKNCTIAALVLFQQMALMSLGYAEWELKSANDLKGTFIIWDRIALGDSVEIFKGKPHVPMADATAVPTLYVFDKKRMTVTPFFSNEDEFAPKDGNILGILLSPDKSHICLTVARPLSKGGISCDLVLLCVADRSREIIVGDGWNNDYPAFSPDGKQIAYYANDPTMSMHGDRAIPLAAGRVVDLQSKRIRTFAEPFLSRDELVAGYPPKWLDEKRVVFCTRSTNREKIKGQLGDFAGDSSACAVLANTESGESKYVFVPQAATMLAATIDEKFHRIIFSDMKIVLQTDMSLESVSILKEVDSRHRISNYKIEEDGGLDFTIVEKGEDKLPPDHPLLEGLTPDMRDKLIQE